MVQHIKRDIFDSGADVILHQVNCQGEMNSGVARQIRERYPIVFERYKVFCDKCKNSPDSLLGIAHFVNIGDNRCVANLFAQDKFGYDGKCYTDYDALRECLIQVRDFAVTFRKTVAMPYLMGCHRGGGDWNTVFAMIDEIFDDVDITICEYDGG